jgi:phage baseplate assembly protein V
MSYAELSRQIENLIRTGTITEVDHANHRCRVASGNLDTDWLPWFALRAGTSKTWDPPTVGEQCIFFSTSGETAAGLVLVGLYSDSNEAPSSSPDEHLRRYPDGALVSYNHKTGTLQAAGIKTALIEASEEITFDCPQVNFTGKVNIANLLTYQNGMVGIGGDATAAVITGDVIANGISLVNHVHANVTPGSGQSGTPV